MMKTVAGFRNKLYWAGLIAALLAAWVVYGLVTEVDADNKPYSISLNSPAKFPVDI